MAYQLASYGLGKVKSVRMGKIEQADIMGMPLEDSNSTLVYSWSGVTRKITVEGLYTPSDGTVSTFITNMEGLLDGDQGTGPGYSFTSGASDYPASASYTVHLEEFDWQWTTDMHTTVHYTMKLIQRA